MEEVYVYMYLNDTSRFFYVVGDSLMGDQIHRVMAVVVTISGPASARNMLARRSTFRRSVVSVGHRDGRIT